MIVSSTSLPPILQGTILSRLEAKQRMHLLEPGTEEHLALQHILLTTGTIAEVCLCSTSYKVNTSENPLLGGFGASEHREIGCRTHLKGLESENGVLLDSGKCEFSDIIALAGDFYGVAGEPVALLEGEEEEKKKRFLAAFETLEKADPLEVTSLVAEIRKESEAVKPSGLPHHCYSHRLLSSTQIFKSIKKDYEDLLDDNSDHFAENAKETYRIGHALACEEASKAGNQDVKRLKRAYALEAFACHFLTDLFASGHIRNQRGPLELFLNGLGLTGKIGKKLAGLLTFASRNATNADRACNAVQCSIDEVYQSYIKITDLSGDSRMDQWIPQIDKHNSQPLYEIKDRKLCLYKEKETVWISDQRDYILEAIPHAVMHLPEKYTNDFIDGFAYPFVGSIDYLDIIPLIPKIVSKLLGGPSLINNLESHLLIPMIAKYLSGSPITSEKLTSWHQVIKKISDPRLERFAGRRLHAFGLPSYAQLQALTLDLEQRTDEMAKTSADTFEKTKEILEEVEQIGNKVDAIQKSLENWPVTKAFDNITKSLITFVHYKNREGLPPNPEKFCHEVWQAKRDLGTAFLDKRILAGYSAKLEKDHPMMHPQERTLRVTEFFHRMITQQIKANDLWIELKTLLKEPEHEIETEKGVFQDALEEQCKANKILSISICSFNKRLTSICKSKRYKQ